MEMRKGQFNEDFKTLTLNVNGHEKHIINKFGEIPFLIKLLKNKMEVDDEKKLKETILTSSKKR